MIARAILIVAMVARAAAAGPWCGHDAAFVPATGATLPVHPRIVFAQDNNATSRKNPEADDNRQRRSFRATLDGKPVRVRATATIAGKWYLRTLDIAADRPGTLVVEVLDPRGTVAHLTATYTLAAAWRAPARATATIARYHDTYHPNEMTKDTDTRDGVAIAVDAPATLFRVDWRRDRDDRWRTFDVPPELGDATARLRLGQIQCTTDNIPLGLLARGVDVRVRARLPDGTWLAVTGVPAPLILPAPTSSAAPSADRATGAAGAP